MEDPNAQLQEWRERHAETVGLMAEIWMESSRETQLTFLIGENATLRKLILNMWTDLLYVKFWSDGDLMCPYCHESAGQRDDLQHLPDCEFVELEEIVMEIRDRKQDLFDSWPHPDATPLDMSVSDGFDTLKENA